MLVVRAEIPWRECPGSGEFHAVIQRLLQGLRGWSRLR